MEGFGLEVKCEGWNVQGLRVGFSVGVGVSTRRPQQGFRVKLLGFRVKDGLRLRNIGMKVWRHRVTKRLRFRNMGIKG